MANEISATVNLAASKTGASVSHNSQRSSDMSGTAMQQGNQNTSTSSVAIAIGACSDIRLIKIVNLSATVGQNVDIASDNGNANKLSTLQPGEFCLLNRPPATLYSRAATGTPEIFVEVIES